MRSQYLTAKRYHLRGITDPFDNFENRETTVSHIFRERHPFLGNRAYGEAIFHAIHDRFGITFSHALEIGGGRGDFAKTFLRAWTRSRPNGTRRYTIVDLSPVLLRSQRRIVGIQPIPIRLIQADAEQLPFRRGSIAGLVIANEMIADLDVCRLVRRAPSANRSRSGSWRIPPALSRAQRAKVRAYLRRSCLETCNGLREVLFPIGLVRLLEELHVAVDGNSLIVLVEYFDEDGGGTVCSYPKHHECSLSLPIVCELARCIGFSVESVPLIEFLDLHVSRPVATSRFLTLLRDKLGHNVSVTLPYTSAHLARLLGRSTWPMGGLFARKELEEFLLPFHVLILRKCRRPTPDDLHSRTILQHEPGVIRLRDRSRQLCLVMTSPPFGFVRLNAIGEEVWHALDGKTSIGKIAAHLGRRYRTPGRRILSDILALLNELSRRHFVRLA